MITEQQTEEVAQRIAQTFRPERVILSGSYAGVGPRQTAT